MVSRERSRSEKIKDGIKLGALITLSILGVIGIWSGCGAALGTIFGPIGIAVGAGIGLALAIGFLGLVGGGLYLLHRKSKETEKTEQAQPISSSSTNVTNKRLAAARVATNNNAHVSDPSAPVQRQTGKFGRVLMGCANVFCCLFICKSGSKEESTPVLSRSLRS